MSITTWRRGAALAPLPRQPLARPTPRPAAEADEDHDDQRRAERAEDPVDLDLTGVQDGERREQPAARRAPAAGARAPRPTALARPRSPVRALLVGHRGSVSAGAPVARGRMGAWRTSCGRRPSTAYAALELRAVEREIVLTLVPGAGMIGASLTHDGRELLHRGDGLAALDRARSDVRHPAAAPLGQPARAPELRGRGPPRPARPRAHARDVRRRRAADPRPAARLAALDGRAHARRRRRRERRRALRRRAGRGAARRLPLPPHARPDACRCAPTC